MLYKSQHKNKIINVCTGILLVVSVDLAFAQKKQMDEPREIFRYERNGVIVYGDKMPNMADIRVDAISRASGLVTETKRYTNEEIATKERQEQEARLAKINQEREDKLDAELLSRYSSETDIETRRKNDIDRITNAIQKDISLQVHLEEQINTVNREISRNPTNKKLELELYKLNKEMEIILDSLEKNKKTLSEKNRQYAEEKVRYRKIIEKRNNK